MDKLWLIIRREYLTRVKRRSFIIATLLTPMAFAVFFAVVGLIFQYESDDSQRIAIIDEGNVLKRSIKDEHNLYFKFVDVELGLLRENFSEFDYDGILVLPKVKDLLSKHYTAYYYSDKQPTLDIESLIRDRVRESLKEYKIEALQLDPQQLEALDTRVELDPEPIDEAGQNASKLTGAVAAGIGGLMGVIMYIVVFIYGMMVMRSVMEEKSNRIVEVMISSVRPFQLMLGKIIGVGAVGLTQVAIWAILIPIVVFISTLVFGFDTHSQMEVAQTSAAADFNPEDMEAMIALALEEFHGLNWWMILPLFIFYFLGGYFLYSSLFAAVGSAMGDDLGEGQSLTIPITIPVVIAFYIMMVAIEAPNSSLAIWSSIFPLFSPIVMPARLAFSPPLWEILASVVVLAASSVFFVWLSGRIYRVGILMYGKKVTLKELSKWMFYRD
ncbi:MAG: ABC transporter permease [Phaeodactylibacter sp.]|nr:ABC transporter permease [Phaeodactylibacter sp.]MCB9276665.1 ABC transporter permease [Lewinellaceae bacterium]